MGTYSREIINVYSDSTVSNLSMVSLLRAIGRALNDDPSHLYGDSNYPPPPPLPSNSLNRLLVALRDIKKHFGHKDPMPYCCTLGYVLVGTREELAVNMAALGESGDRVLYAF